ncbi:MAG: hypothetical protein OEM29_00320 [Thermoplasmata archaeon]|nr:hypothetical protein [Thermoplasmata archaeon]
MGGEPPRMPIRVEKGVFVTTRDGVRLCADTHMPKAEGKYPAIVTRLPYGESEYCSWSPVYGRFWARRCFSLVKSLICREFEIRIMNADCDSISRFQR